MTDDLAAVDEDVQLEAYPHVCRGGQHVGISTGIRATHVPSGISVIATHERSQFANKQAAVARLKSLLAAEAALAAVHDELYSNASVSLEFAVHDLTSKRHHTEKTVGLVNEAQQSIWRAVAAARAPLP